MRKIISAILVVVMLAALAVAFPASAAATHGLVITEINANTSALSGTASIDDATNVKASAGIGWHDRSFVYEQDDKVWTMTNQDLFEFVELYNAGKEPISIYDYSLTLKSGDAAAADKAEKVTAIANAKQMKEAGNKLGTISTATLPGTTEADYDFYSTSIWAFYPTNTEDGVINPGETAVIWMYTAEAYAYNLVISETIPTKNEELAINFDTFKEYWGMDENAKVYAVDANCAEDNITLYKFDGAAFASEDDDQYNGYNPASKDNDESDDTTYTVWSGDKIVNRGAVAERFNLANDAVYTVGIGKTETAKTAAHSELSAYACVNYADADAEKNLMYKATAGIKADSYPDISYNYIYAADSNKAEAYGVQVATAGKIYADQAAELFAVISSEVSDKINDEKEFIYKCGNKNDNITKLGKVVDIYSEDFESQTVGSASASALEWKRQWQSNGNFFDTGSTVNRKNKIEEVVKADGTKSKVFAINQDAKTANLVTIKSNDALKAEFATEKAIEANNGNALNADMLYEYEIHFTGANTGGADRWIGMAINGNTYDSYELFALTSVGTAVSFRREGRAWSSAETMDYDAPGKIYSRNTDKNSVISKLTNGAVLAGDPTSTKNNDNVRLVGLNEWVKVQVVYDQDKGLFALVNGILVSVPSNEALVGLARNKGEYGIGIQAASNVGAQIDNIKVTAIPEEGIDTDGDEEIDILGTKDYIGDYLDLAYANSDSMEPKTGDAVIYVAVAMVVSFISLAALVVVKKRTEK